MSCNCRSKSSSGNNNNRCKGCICNQLRRLDRGTEVDVFLSGGKVLEDVIFLRFNRNNCCAIFRDEKKEPGSILIVDCKKIDALRIEAD
ncbi:hydrolase [Ureibacillus sp. NPDC094379]